jgi:acyl dehydratase
MASRRFEDVEFGEELPPLEPDLSIENVRKFGRAAEMVAPRFSDHEGARKEGLPGAIVPGVMSQAILVAMIHRWAENAELEKIDTVFRAPVLVDHPHRISGVVTNLEAETRTAEIDLTIVNEAGETRVLGTARVRLATQG